MSSLPAREQFASPAQLSAQSTHQHTIPIGKKLCGRCKEIKALDEFYRAKDRTDGFRWDCKECVKKFCSNDASKKWHLANKERCAESQKKWREANKEKCAESRRKWETANKDKVRAYREKWNEKNPEKVRFYATKYLKNKEKRQPLTKEEKKEKARIQRKNWEAKNHEKVKERNKNKWIKYADNVRTNTRNRKARLRNSIGTHTASDIRKLKKLQKNQCAICKTSINAGFHVDHVFPIARGGTNDINNLQILCETCNTSKGAKDPIEFMQSKGFLI